MLDTECVCSGCHTRTQVGDQRSKQIKGTEAAPLKRGWWLSDMHTLPGLILGHPGSRRAGTTSPGCTSSSSSVSELTIYFKR